MIGEIVGSYRITARINEGGMGVVYRAEHTLIGRVAAVKVLLAQFSNNRDIVARFFNEAKVTSAIRHPGIVEIYDFGFHASGQAFLVMELLGGQSLAAHLHGGRRLDEAAAAQLVRAVSGALAAAHDAGVVHRDLKPDNIYLVPDPDTGAYRPKILDFGIAKLAQAADVAGSVKTRTGSVIGTPMYMSPEQCRGTGTLDARADLYSLGCILYEMVAGRPPFVSEGAGEIIGMHQHVAPEPPRRLAPGLSPEMDALILMLLAKRAEQRPSSAMDLIARLDRMYGRPATLTSPGLAPSQIPDASHLAPTVMAPSSARSPVPTTFGGSASELLELPARRRPRWAIAAIAGAAVIGGIAAIVAVSQKAPTRKAAEAPAAIPAAAPGPAPAPTPAAPAPAETAQVTPPPAPVITPLPTPTPTPTPTVSPTPTPTVSPTPTPTPARVAKKKPAAAPKKRPRPKPTRKNHPAANADPIETHL